MNQGPGEGGQRGLGEHERWRGELAAYALGALSADEASAVEAHLDDCDACQADLRWLRPAVNVLPESVPQHEQPGGLRERVLREIRADVAAHQGDRAAAAPRRRGLAGLVLRPATALVTAAVVAAGVAGYALNSGGGTDTIELRGEPRAMLKRNGDSGTLEISRLEPLRADNVYQAWVQDGDRIRPSSLFVPNEEGRASAAIPRGLEDADAVMVTVEPRGGSRTPSANLVLALRLD